MKRILFGFIALLAGSILAAPVHANNGLNIDSIEDYVDYTDCASLQMSTAVTVEAWVYLTRTTICQGIVSKLVHEGDRVGYSLEVWKSNKLCFLVGGNWSDRCWAESTTPLAADRWYHVAGTYDSRTIRVYIDGVLCGSTTYNKGIVDSGSPLLIGRRYGYRPLEGKIDMVSVWNIARTGEQIVHDMNGVVASGTSGLVAQYSFDKHVADGEITSITTLYNYPGNYPVTDETGGSTYGSLQNFTLDSSYSSWDR